METMKGAILPGNSTVELRDFEIPKPGFGQVLIKTMASTICGSDIRCIYREHVGKGPEAYIPGTIAGHEPCGQIVEEGQGLRRFKKGDRVIVYHISGCGVCHDCRKGYYISCKSKYRRAYGWQRDGGMAPYILAEEKDLIPLPEPLTYKDGAQVACGFGTVYEAIGEVSTLEQFKGISAFSFSFCMGYVVSRKIGGVTEKTILYIGLAFFALGVVRYFYTLSVGTEKTDNVAKNLRPH